MVWDILRRSPATFVLPATRLETGSILRRALSVQCVLVALALAGCDPMLEQRYYAEGIGTDLAAQGAQSAADLQDIYLNELCRQAGMVEMVGAEPVRGCPNPYGVAPSPSWRLVALAGMNDIDQRCDAYLTWLDDKRRSQAPILAEINALQGAAQNILRTTGVGANPITLVGIAFGLASSTFTNVRSRLLLEVNHSTVESIVLKRQKDYRDGLPQVIDTRTAAIYAMRSYLRICMPMTIETEINTTVATFEQAGLDGLRSKDVNRAIDPKTIASIRSDQPVTPTNPPAAVVLHAANQIEGTITLARAKLLQSTLCVTPSGDFGPPGQNSQTRNALVAFNTAVYFGSDPMPAITDTVASSKLRNALNQAQATYPSCGMAGFRNAFEVGVFTTVGSTTVRKQITDALGAKNLPVPQGLSGSGANVDLALRNAIAALRMKFGDGGKSELDSKFYDWIVRATDRN